LECRCFEPIVPTEEDVPEITRRPVLFENLDLKISQELKNKLKHEITRIPSWLGSEQLMVWDWVFD
jgi:hypothetical protein